MNIVVTSELPLHLNYLFGNIVSKYR